MLFNILVPAMLAAGHDSVCAQSYPARPIRLIVGGAPGSVPDTMVRPVAERLSAALGQRVVVDNRPGAAGIIAMEALIRSAPDGYTVALATMSQAVFNSYLFSRLPYDPLRDLEPVAPLVTGAMVLAAHPSFPPRSLQDVKVMAQKQAGKLLVAMPQSGSPPHVVALLLKRAARLDFTMVPHKSGAEAVATAVSGAVPLLIDAPTIISPHVTAGRLKALLVTGREREPALPEVPTISESGLVGVHGEAWIGIVAPAGTPTPIVQRLNREIAAVLGTPHMHTTLAELSFRTLKSTSEDFRKLIRDEHVRWSTLIREAGLRLD